MDAPTAERWKPGVFFGEEMQQARATLKTGSWPIRSVRIDGTYTTPSESHCAMEPHAVLAQWDGKKLLVHEPSQWMHGIRNYLAVVFEMEIDDVQVLSPHGQGGGQFQRILVPGTRCSPPWPRANSDGRSSCS